MRTLLALLVAAAAAAAHADAPQSVEIKAIRDPVDKSYRRMIRGMDLFEEMRGLAPAAALRFKLLPRKGDTDMHEIALRIVGETFKAPVSVAPDRTFSLERLPRAHEEDAVVRSERRADTMTWRADARTPGLPAHVRRLGDLRLECLVGMEAGLVSRYPGILGRVFDALESPAEYCTRAEPRYLFFAERPLFAVTLRSGARTQVLSIGRMYAGSAEGDTPAEELRHCDCEALLDRAYAIPLGDTSWPDDTLVEFDYMDTPVADAASWVRAQDGAQAISVGTPRDEVLAALGEGKGTRFASGYEVRSYAYGSAAGRFAKTEFVVLFNPSGRVAKTRLRRAPGVPS